MVVSLGKCVIYLPFRYHVYQLLTNLFPPILDDELAVIFDYFYSKVSTIDPRILRDALVHFPVPCLYFVILDKTLGTASTRLSFLSQEYLVTWEVGQRRSLDTVHHLLQADQYCHKANIKIKRSYLLRRENLISIDECWNYAQRRWKMNRFIQSCSIFQRAIIQMAIIFLCEFQKYVTRRTLQRGDIWLS